MDGGTPIDPWDSPLSGFRDPVREKNLSHIVAECSKNPGYVYVYCTNPACRGRKLGANGFTVYMKREEVEKRGAFIECSECFSN